MSRISSCVAGALDHHRARYFPPVFALVAIACLLVGGAAVQGSSAPHAGRYCEGQTDACARCATERIAEPESLPDPLIDATDRTIAVPWPRSGKPSGSPAVPKATRTTDPAWDLIDSTSVYRRLDPSEHLAVEFDHASGSLITHAPPSDLSSLAEQAVAKAPTWLQQSLEDTFARLHVYFQDLLADVILNTNDPYVDEVAWSVAHISINDIMSSDFHMSLISENASLLYAVAADVTYADIVDYGDSIQGGDYYSTVRYKVKEGDDISEYEYDRDIYYWFIVHPRGSDERPIHIDPDAPCSSAGTPAAPPEGRFWREAFYYGMPTHFGQCDNDHDGIKDGPCPVLRDLLMDVDVLWEMKKDVVGVENGALGQASDWVHRTLGRWGDMDGCRPIQPITIAYWQDGNCGEYQDMQTAAGRTALIPTISVSAHANDHVWNEFYERRWIEWQAEDEQIDHPEGHDGWTGGLAALHTWRGDGHGWTDSTAHYSPTCQLVVTITDANGYPVDSARVDIASEPYNILCNNHSTVFQISRGYTDENGEVAFTLGDTNQPDCRKYYLRVHADFDTGGFDYPGGGSYALVIDEPQADTTYYWSHQFTGGEVSRLSVSPASTPPDPAIDNLMEVTYSVTDEYLYGGGFITFIGFREDIRPGDLDVFLADSFYYGRFAAGRPFEAYEIAIDSPSADVSFVPPATDDWYAVWSNEATLKLAQVVDATVRLYSNNGYVAPVCELTADRGDAGETLLDWEDLTGINVDVYNVYRSTAAADVGKDKTGVELAPYLIATVSDSTCPDATLPAPGEVLYYSVRTVGKSGDVADDCQY